jgi:hypothetical protein
MELQSGESLTLTNRTPRLQDAIMLIAAAVAIALWGLSVTSAEPSKMGGLGLVSVVGWPYFAGLFLVGIGITSEIARSKLREGFLILFVVILVIFIFGTSSAVEPVASLQDTWLHASFTQYILQHGAVLQSFDGRFSWPGAFSLAAVMSVFVGHANALVFLRWFPLFIELLYFLPVYVIAHHIDVSRRARWLGVVIFYATDWIYQDYFSPQALSYLLYLIILAAVLAVWKARNEEFVKGLRARWTRTISAISFRRLNGDEAESQWTTTKTLVIILFLGLISFAISFSHQLTPFALVLALCVLLVTRRLGRPEVILFAILFTVGWLSLGASNFWVGHLSLIFGSFGDIGSAAGANVVNRVTGSASHVFVTQLRIVIIGILYLIAGIGALRRSAQSRTLEMLVGAAFLLVAAQNYGGEGLMRAVLYVLPFTSMLAASAFFPLRLGPITSFIPHHRVNRVLSLITIALVFLSVFGFSIATSVARGGNDAYESFTPGEVDAVTYVYNHVKPGQLVGEVTFYVPAGQKNFYNVSGLLASGGSPVPLKNIRRTFVQYRPKYIILTRAQQEWGTIVAGYPRNWESQLSKYLLTQHYQVVASWSTAEVLLDRLPVWG